MKIRRFFITCLSVLFILSAVTLYAQDQAAKIAELSGQVQVKISPSTEWTDASSGQLLVENDSIKTEAEAKALLELSDKSTISLKPNTVVTIEELILNDMARKIGVNMSVGELRAIVKKVDTPSEFKVKTPNAITGAVGTIYYVFYKNEVTKICVAEGSVEVTDPLTGETYTVIEGMVLTINADGSITGPEEISDTELAELMAGWEILPTAEPYTPPAGGDTGVGDLGAPELIEESAASVT